MKFKRELTAKVVEDIIVPYHITNIESLEYYLINGFRYDLIDKTPEITIIPWVPLRDEYGKLMF